MEFFTTHFRDPFLVKIIPQEARNNFESKMERDQWFFLGLRVVSLGIMWEPVACFESDLCVFNNDDCYALGLSWWLTW